MSALLLSSNAAPGGHAPTVSSTNPTSTITASAPSIMLFTSTVLEIDNAAPLRPLISPYLQASDCSTQWWVVSSLGMTAASSGATVEGKTGAQSQYCYPSTGAQAYSPGMCFNGQVPTLIVERSKQVSWQALCCPRCVGSQYPLDYIDKSTPVEWR